jgi:hypothetical protein
VLSVQFGAVHRNGGFSFLDKNFEIFFQIFIEAVKYGIKNSGFL